MIYTSTVTITADTKINKLAIIKPDGERIVLTFGGKRKLGVDVVADDKPVGHFENPKDLIRYLVQHLYTPEQIEADLANEQLFGKDPV